MKVRSIAGAAGAMALGASAFAQTPALAPEQWKIVEGVGLSDQVLYIGQLRKKVKKLSPSCGAKVSECSFQLAPSAQTITVNFTGNKVSRLRFVSVKDEFFFPPFGFHWGTARGAVPPMQINDVDALYPEGSAQCGPSFGGCLIDMPALGYAWHIAAQCDEVPVIGCLLTYTQTVYPKSGT